MSCDKAREALEPLVDKELSGFARARLQGHLFRCQRCRRTLRELREVDAAVRRLPSPAQPERLKQRILATVSPRPRVTTALRTPRPMATWGTLVALGVLVFVSTHAGIPPAQAEVARIREAVDRARTAHMVLYSRPTPHAAPVKQGELWYREGRLRIEYNGRTAIMAGGHEWVCDPENGILERPAPAPELWTSTLQLVRPEVPREALVEAVPAPVAFPGLPAVEPARIPGSLHVALHPRWSVPAHSPSLLDSLHVPPSGLARAPLPSAKPHVSAAPPPPGTAARPLSSPDPVPLFPQVAPAPASAAGRFDHLVLRADRATHLPVRIDAFHQIGALGKEPHAWLILEFDAPVPARLFDQEALRAASSKNRSRRALSP